MTEIATKINVRAHEVDTDALVTLLRGAKKRAKLTNKAIAERLNRPVTEVEHWFRADDYGTIPSADIWFDLKAVLGIQTEEFDAQVTEFVEQDGQFDMTNRAYEVTGLAPCVIANSNIKIVVRDEPEARTDCLIRGGS